MSRRSDSWLTVFLLIFEAPPDRTLISTSKSQSCFPQAAQFIEKPISGAPIEDVEKVEEALRSGGLTSIGYMLRYLARKSCLDASLL